MTTQVDKVGRWMWWKNALKGDFGQASESHPEQGYYRVRRKGGQWEPVAIWYDDESQCWYGTRGARNIDDINSLWVWALRQPITYDQYERAMRGEGFDDEPPAPIGHNIQAETPLDAITLELAGEAMLAAEFLGRPIESQADADKVSIWAKRLLDISKRADSERVAEKQPHLDAGREVDSKWKPIVDGAADLARKLKQHVEPFLKAKKAEAVAAAAVTGAEIVNARAGRTGATVSLRKVRIAVIDDYLIAASALVDMENKDMLREVERLAQAAASKGIEFAGMHIEIQEKAQ